MSDIIPEIVKHTVIEEVENGFYVVYRDNNGNLVRRMVFNKKSDLLKFVSLYFEKAKPKEKENIK